ncbi:zinc ribbon domain-containing protein [Acutalibacter sp. 1XD8-33]|uniref:zinc ribbon domain-containing protein n=1 Tax=Acutalibacter sp. 1XD8-33 TaxID=2320081 RepID=UPI0011C3E831|nr:zinc ribbon domain-containing protein [Acutalibacter sp. 1XD8-33]
MPFFEQLGKKITDVSQGVAQQTKNLTDITRLNSAISDKERQISQLYLEIGQAYYQKHSQDNSAEEWERIAAINALGGEIQKCRREISQIKGFVQCPNCGGDVPLHAQFCNACGAKMPPPAAAEVPEDARICPACGAVMGPENKFCMKCGAKLEVDSQPQDEAQ